MEKMLTFKEELKKKWEDIGILACEEYEKKEYESLKKDILGHIGTGRWNPKRKFSLAGYPDHIIDKLTKDGVFVHQVYDPAKCDFEPYYIDFNQLDKPDIPF